LHLHFVPQGTEPQESKEHSHKGLVSNKDISDMNKRLDSIGLQRKERGGGGNCFYDSAGAEVGLSGIVVRELAAEFLRSNPAENEKFVCEPFEKFCSDVATKGTWVNGGPEITAVSKVLDRDICILGRNPAHDLYIGTRGTDPIILLYWEDEQHFTGVEKKNNDWRKANSTGVRSEQHSQLLKSELLSQESERIKVIMQARSKTVAMAAVKKGDVEPTCEISTAALLEEEQLNFTLAASKSEEEAKKNAHESLFEEEEMKVAMAVSKSEEEAKESADATLALTEEEQMRITMAVSKSEEEAKKSADATLALTDALALEEALALSESEHDARLEFKKSEFDEMKRTEVCKDAKVNLKIAAEMELLEADMKSRAQSKHSFFRTLTMFLIACFVIIGNKFPVASGNFTSLSGSGTFTLSDVNLSPQGSRTQQLFSESPGGTHRTGTIFLTPESGDKDKQSRAKRQSRNSATRKRILQPGANAASNAAKYQRYWAPFECLCLREIEIHAICNFRHKQNHPGAHAASNAAAKKRFSEE
jgi:hypothetical protein